MGYGNNECDRKKISIIHLIFNLFWTGSSYKLHLILIKSQKCSFFEGVAQINRQKWSTDMKWLFIIIYDFLRYCVYSKDIYDTTKIYCAVCVFYIFSIQPATGITHKYKHCIECNMKVNPTKRIWTENWI